MSSIMKKLQYEAERARFEAGRALRLQREQGKLGQLQSQRSDQFQALGEAVWEMYLAGQVTDTRLVTVCRQIQAVQQQIVDQDQQIERIKQELAPEPPKCGNCGRELGSSETFCPGCGTPVVAALPPAAPGTAPCPHCGKPVRAGAAFCGGCGQKV